MAPLYRVYWQGKVVATQRLSDQQIRVLKARGMTVIPV